MLRLLARRFTAVDIDNEQGKRWKIWRKQKSDYLIVINFKLKRFQNDIYVITKLTFGKWIVVDTVVLRVNKVNHSLNVKIFYLLRYSVDRVFGVERRMTSHFFRVWSCDVRETGEHCRKEQVKDGSPTKVSFMSKLVLINVDVCLCI